MMQCDVDTSLGTRPGRISAQRGRSTHTLSLRPDALGKRLHREGSEALRENRHLQTMTYFGSCEDRDRRDTHSSAVTAVLSRAQMAPLGIQSGPVDVALV